MRKIMQGVWSESIIGVSSSYICASQTQVLIQNRKISNNPQLSKNLKKIEIRNAQSSTIGFIASEESTEGENIGVVFTVAITAKITKNCQKMIPGLIKTIVDNKKEFCAEKYNEGLSQNVKILIQGLMLFVTFDAFAFIRAFKKFRDSGDIFY
jgi:DNA-directed RNA polymerase beta subunit